MEVKDKIKATHKSHLLQLCIIMPLKRRSSHRWKHLTAVTGYPVHIIQIFNFFFCKIQGCFSLVDGGIPKKSH